MLLVGHGPGKAGIFVFRRDIGKSETFGLSGGQGCFDEMRDLEIRM